MVELSLCHLASDGPHDLRMRYSSLSYVLCIFLAFNGGRHRPFLCFVRLQLYGGFNTNMSEQPEEWTDAGPYHFTFEAHQIRYHAVKTGVELPIFERNTKHRPVTLMRAQSGDLDDELWLEHNLQTFRALKYDVWSSHFLDRLVISSLGPLHEPVEPALVQHIERLTCWYAFVYGWDLPVSESLLLNNASFVKPIRPVRIC